jgi:hypothetical protein
MKENNKVTTQDPCKRDRLVVLLGRDEFAGAALDEPDYLEVGHSEGTPFSEFVSKCREDIEGLTESLLELLPTMSRSRPNAKEKPLRREV